MIRKLEISERVSLFIAETAAESASSAAQHFVEIADESLSASRRFRVALSGGRTPMSFYQALVQEQAHALDWTQVDFFWSDERMAPPDHVDSNYGLASALIFKPLHIADAQIYRMVVEQGRPEQIAAEYEKTIRSVLGDSPVFDLILLGLGEDGHTASLFPDSAALGYERQWVGAHWVEKLSAHRITFTFTLLNQARHIMFLAHGEKKAVTLADVLSLQLHPAALVKPKNGDIDWFVDEAAAAQIVRQRV